MSIHTSVIPTKDVTAAAINFFLVKSVQESSKKKLAFFILLQQHLISSEMGKRNNKNRHGNSGNFKNQNRNNVQKNRKHQDNNNNQKPAQHQQQPGKKVEKINTSIKAPLFDKSKLLSTWKINRKIGPGYVNGQNTCFLNSVLECLTYTPPLAQQMLREEHQKQCRMDGFCALCAMEVHVRRCLKDEKSFSKGAAILPRYFTSNLRGNVAVAHVGSQARVD